MINKTKKENIRFISKHINSNNSNILFVIYSTDFITYYNEQKKNYGENVSLKELNNYQQISV
jgi:hypothetical protein